MQTRAKFLFVSDSRYMGHTPYRFWSDLNNFLTRSENRFLNFVVRGSSQFSVWNPNFFPTQTIAQKLIVLGARYNGDNLCQIWYDLSNFLTRSKRSIFKILYSRNFQVYVWNSNSFPTQAIAFFCFRLWVHREYFIPSLVWFGQLLDPMKKTYF